MLSSSRQHEILFPSSLTKSQRCPSVFENSKPVAQWTVHPASDRRAVHQRSVPPRLRRPITLGQHWQGQTGGISGELELSSMVIEIAADQGKHCEHAISARAWVRT